MLTESGKNLSIVGVDSYPIASSTLGVGVRISKICKVSSRSG